MVTNSKLQQTTLIKYLLTMNAKTSEKLKDDDQCKVVGGTHAESLAR